MGHYGAMVQPAVDAVVVGAGPNGLAAAIEIARAGRSVLVVEAQDNPGGGSRSDALTLPGFVHDTCSAIHPLALMSPFLKRIPLTEFGLEWAHPEIPLAHPLDDGTAGVLERSVGATAEYLGPDGDAYRKLMAPLVPAAEMLAEEILGPIRPPRHPIAFARFGLLAIQPSTVLARRRFQGPRAQALLGGMAAHSLLKLNQPITAGISLALGMFAHAVGWPAARGGSQKIADGLVAYLDSMGGRLQTGTPVRSLDELPDARAIVVDVTPRQLIDIAGDRLHPVYRRRLRRFRYGPGVFKIDYALDGPVPWKAEECRRAGTVHLGGTLEEVAAAEDAVAGGRHPENPYVLVAQQSMFDTTRAPEGKHTLWTYCHVPNGSTVDMTDRIESQLERFAPGFRDIVLGRCVMPPQEVERRNENYVGGDINGGVQDLMHWFTRPVAKLDPYSIPLRHPPRGCEGLFMCSSSTPPGGGVHGMCGYFAAKSALRRALS
jgi:phytoene dehydrogenase-like protein